MNPIYLPIRGRQGEESVLTLLNVSRSTLTRIRQRCDDFPKPVIYSRSCIRFKKADLLDWMESRKGTVAK